MFLLTLPHDTLSAEGPEQQLRNELYLMINCLKLTSSSDIVTQRVHFKKELETLCGSASETWDFSFPSKSPGACCDKDGSAQ